MILANILAIPSCDMKGTTYNALSFAGNDTNTFWRLVRMTSYRDCSPRSNSSRSPGMMGSIDPQSHSQGICFTCHTFCLIQSNISLCFYAQGHDWLSCHTNHSFPCIPLHIGIIQHTYFLIFSLTSNSRYFT